MKSIYRWINILLLLSLTACGVNVYIAGLRIDIVGEATETVAPSATASPSATPSPTASPTQIVGLLATTTANVNLRTAPSTNNVPIRVIPAGTQIRLIARLSDNTWARTADGWVYTQNLSVAGNINTLPVYQIDPTPTQERRKSRISYNINAQAIPDRALLEAHLLDLCPTTVTVMESLAYAIELYNLLRSCNTIVIHRSYSSLEGSEWFYRSPQNFVDQWNREGHREIVRYSTNEPSFGGSQSKAQFVAAEVELMRLARAAGFTVAMGNFSVGIVQPEDMNAGVYDPYIRGLIQYGHYLALHEYAVVALPFGVGQWQTSYLQDRTRLQPASWPIASALPVRRWDNQLPPYWYLRRGDWWLLRADYLGIARPRIILTEFGWDNLPNIKPAIEPLRQVFGIDRYFRDLSGINTYQNLWAWYWPQWTFVQAACQQLGWADSIYPAEYIGLDLFTWSSSPDWRATDYSGRENPALYQLQDCLERGLLR